MTAPTQGFRQATPARPTQQVPPQVGGPKRYPLPPIDQSRLLTPGQVVDKYPQLITHKRITRFAVRLAQEAYFGRDVMMCCTMKGSGQYHAIPPVELSQLKKFLHGVCVPRLYQSRVEWERTWKDCWDSIGQSCKNLRGT